MWNPDIIPPPGEDVYHRYGLAEPIWPVIAIAIVLVLAAVLGLRT